LKPGIATTRDRTDSGRATFKRVVKGLLTRLYACMFSHKSFVLLVTQIYAMPVFDMIETVLVRKFGFRPRLMLRLIARSVYVGNGSI